ncbi:LuxR family transcriptional regulator [Clostridium sp. P21]|uniref:LuxR family transcriptional regulator n=1 Tax=Clostridium muellerianum TaxID=2716538 RepID=A0A7Y0HPZ5_9CLOT|nr:LuxR C-terminal-related transcriptional regulator [Clostridium muellerianum]NMM63571.1 LuxR family transcriptional regulator [Clostridium muellerianum]
MILNYKYNKTKFLIPKRKCKLIFREKVVKKLDGALKTKLTIISAPAGSGKTTSVISWINSEELQNNVVWLSLDERDNNPDIFWSSFIAAIEKFKEKYDKSEKVNFKDNDDIPMETIVDIALNSISSIDENLIFVIDDFHFIKNKDILTGIKHFIDGIFDNIHIIITSRSKTNINVSKLRLNGEVTEIDRKDLSFSLKETLEFINENVEFRISKESTKALNECTEGWIAGIQIAVLSMNRRKDITDIEERFSGNNEYIHDYFCEEIFNVQSGEIKEFLLKTCILDELNADLCNAVSGRKNSQKILEEICDKNLFIEKLDYDGKSFRYCRLFEEFLISQLNGINKEEVFEISNKAAGWYEKNEHIDNAINQYIKVENYEQAVKLIEDKCVKKVFTNEYFYVLEWLKSIPQDIIVKKPRFCIACMHMYINDDISYYKYLEFTEKALDNCSDENYKKECIGILAIIKGDKIFIKSEYEKSKELYERALGYLEKDTFWHAIINLKLGVVSFYLQDFVLQKRYFHEALLLSQSYEDDVLYLVVNRTIIFIKLLMGELIECENICNICLNSSMSDEFKNSSLMAIFYIGLSLIYYEKNDINKSEEYVLKGLKLVEDKWDIYTAFIGYYVYSGIILEKDSKNKKVELDKIHERIEELSQKGSDYKILDKYYFHKLKDNFKVLKMRRLMEQGKINSAEKYITKRDFKITEELIIFSKILIHKGKSEDALMILNKILTSEKEINNKYIIIRSYILRSEIFSQKDQYENATRDLREALIVGSENGFIRIFLIKQVKTNKILLKTIKSMKYNKDYYKINEYLNKILNLYSSGENNEIISKREKEVLMLIESGAKNSEIAKTLFITESTAKSHILNIFSKLAVRNRVQAVAKAKEIGII